MHGQLHAQQGQPVWLSFSFGSDILTEYFSRRAELRTQWDRVNGKGAARTSPMDPVMATAIKIPECRSLTGAVRPTMKRESPFPASIRLLN